MKHLLRILLLAAVFTAAAGLPFEATASTHTAACSDSPAANPAPDTLTPSWDLGLSVGYTSQHGRSNVGVQAMAVMHLTPCLGWRFAVAVNGFVPNGFDRYATAMTGPVVILGPVYAFMQAGAVCNPSARFKAGVAAGLGAGVAFDVGRRSRIFAEASVDTVQDTGNPKSTLSVGVGYAFHL